jgi:hypothetical protein
MATLTSRVRRLEAASGGGSRCPECGFDGDWSKVKFEPRINRVDPKSPRMPPNRHCGTCGRVLVINVGWGRGDPDQD